LLHPVPLFLVSLLCVLAFVLFRQTREREEVESGLVRSAKVVAAWFRRADLAIVIGASSFSISIVALVVSIATAAIALKQMAITRDHNRKSVMPALQITTHLEGEGGRNGIYISNDGLGPAYLKDFSVKYKDTIRSGLGPSKWVEILTVSSELPICFSEGWPEKDAILKPGLETPLLHVADYKNIDICGSEVAQLMEVEPLEFFVLYESGYGDERVLRKSSGERRKSSEKSRNEYFANQAVRNAIRRSLQ